MSKRSSRRKRVQRWKKQKARQTGPALAEEGSKAFKQADYDEAIKAWQQARQKKDAPGQLPAALAEAYFRRAVSNPAPALDDLKQAVELKPGEPRYRYHLALTHHRLGHLDQAESIYRRLLAASPPYDRAAMPLAQLLIEQKKAPAQDPLWEHLNQEAQTQLEAAEALVKKNANAKLRRLADEPLDPLWRGLIAVALGDKSAARQDLQAALASESELPALPCSVAQYYLGVLAAGADQTEQALEHWQAARAGGLDTPHLRRNLSNLAYQQAVAEQQAGHPRQALDLLEQVNGSDVSGQALQELRQQLNLAVGYAAAQKGDWKQALDQWEETEKAGDTGRRLLFNLALAYQKMERPLEAAEHWRTLLRRRPRKSTHPDALTDQQVARIWQNVAENYSAAGEYDEAVTTYKNAVKWAPDNLELRLQLVEALQTEGRWQAAENELNRILDKNPDHVPALILLAESYAGDFYPDRARNILLRVLELEPQHPIARQQLAGLYEQQGLFIARWGQLESALEIYKEGLELVPDNQRLHTLIGGTYADLGDFDQARQHLDRAVALKPDDLPALHTIFLIWLHHESEPDLDRIFDHLKAITPPIPGGFWIDLIDLCLEDGDEERAETMLEFTTERYADDEQTMISLALINLNLDQRDQAVAILRRILKDNPDHAEAHLRLGMVYYQMGQTRLGERHWQKAERQARKENNQMLLHELNVTRDMLVHGRPPPRNPLELFQSLPPEFRESMLDQAPPEIADMLRDMDPETLAALFASMAGRDLFDDDFDEDYF